MKAKCDITLGKYDDIINLPHHQSSKRPHMSMRDRAAQFAPFAALTGYGSAINETKRLTDKKIELNDDEKQELNAKLNYIANNLDSKPKVAFAFFVPDAQKSGGAYINVTGIVKKIDTYENCVVLEDERRIAFDDIIGIESEIFIALE